MPEILGCVSSRRICTRVRIGPMRDCTSPTRRFTVWEVRRIWTSSSVRITTCTIRASAATMLKISSHTCIRAPLAPLGAETGTAGYLVLTASTPAGTLRVLLQPLPKSNPSCVPPLLFRVRSVHRRVRAVRALCAARILCLHPLSSKENRASHRRTLAQKERPPGRQYQDPPENNSLWNLHCPP